MKFLVLAAALCLAVTTVYGNPLRVKCYVCQWTSLTGYTSPFTQNDCTDAGLRRFPRAFIQECDNGCMINKVKQGNTVISEARSCSGSASNRMERKRICSGDDCSRSFTALATTVTAAGTRSKCRQIGANSAPNLVNFTDIYLNVSQPAINCTTANTVEKHQYCFIKETKKDKAAESAFGTYAHSYEMGCEAVIKAQFSGLDYMIESKNCMNSFCNKYLDDGASDPTTTVEPSTTPEPTKTGSSVRPAVIFIMLMALFGYLL